MSADSIENLKKKIADLDAHVDRLQRDLYQTQGAFASAVTSMSQAFETRDAAQMENSRLKAAKDELAAVLASLDKEVCVCAAIRLDDGRIIRGHRHDDCIHTAAKWRAAGQDVGTLHMGQQGFLTSRGRFVDRREAYALQVAAGLTPDRPGAHILTSEDLY